MINYLALEPDRMHASGDATIAEVAEKLERDYQLSEKFFNHIEDRIEPKLMELLEREAFSPSHFEKSLAVLSEWLTMRWREWIKNEEHGIKTLASRERGTPSFVDTTDYFLNMRVVVG